MKTKTKKTQKADAPLTRDEFKAAISKMSRNDLIGLLCDVYYAHTKGCECDCGCGSDSKKTPSKVSKKK